MPASSKISMRPAMMAGACRLCRGISARSPSWPHAAVGAVPINGQYFGRIYSSDLNTDTLKGVYGAYDAFFLADATLSYQFEKYVTAFVNAQNVLDRQYHEYYLAPDASCRSACDSAYESAKIDLSELAMRRTEKREKTQWQINTTIATSTSTLIPIHMSTRTTSRAYS